MTNVLDGFVMAGERGAVNHHYAKKLHEMFMFRDSCAAETRLYGQSLRAQMGAYEPIKLGVRQNLLCLVYYIVDAHRKPGIH